MGRPGRRARRERRRVHPRCSGDRSERRCWHVAAKTRRRSGSPTRPSLGEVTDFLDGQGDTNADLGEVLLLAGKREEAIAALDEALERYERKGNLVSAERVGARLDEIRAAARTE
jgi:predicted Zn-dependent protease